MNIVNFDRREQKSGINTDLTIEKNRRLVRQIARTVQSNVSGAVEMEDLVQVGFAALIEASRKFVDRGEASFTTYATMRIRGAMIDETRKLSTMTRRALRQRRALQSLRTRLSTELGRSPSHDEIATSAEMTKTDYLDLLNSHQGFSFCSLDQVYSDSNPSFVDSSPCPEAQTEASLAAEALAAAIETLPERQKLILHLCFVEELNLIEIGEVLNVTPARVCQLKKVALDKLGVALSNWA